MPQAERETRNDSALDTATLLQYPDDRPRAALWRCSGWSFGLRPTRF